MADNTQISEEPTYRLTNDSEEPATKADIERLRSELNAGLSLKTSQHDFDYIVGDGKQGWTITDYIIRLEEQWHEAMSLMASKADLADNSTTDQTKLKKLIMVNESSSSDTKLALSTSGTEEIELATMDDFDKLESYFTFDWEWTWERGGINASGATEESTSILRTASYIPSRDFTATLDNAYSFQAVRYDEDKKFIKKDNWVIGSNRLQYATKDVAGTKYVKFLIKKNDGSNLTDVTLPKSILSVSMNGTDFTGKNNNIAMDPSVLNDVVQVSDTKPTSAINEIWVKPQGSEIEIPTMDELDALADGVVRHDVEQTINEAGKERARGNIGAASVEDVEGLQNDLTEKTSQLKRPIDSLPMLNVYNASTNTVNSYINQNGQVVVQNGWVVTDFMSVSNESEVFYNGVGTPGDAPYSAFYTSDRSLISTFKTKNGKQTLEIPSACKYVRFSIINEDVDTFEFYGDELATLTDVVGIEENRNNITKLTMRQKEASSYLDEVNYFVSEDISAPVANGYWNTNTKSFSSSNSFSTITVPYDKDKTYLYTGSVFNVNFFSGVVFLDESNNILAHTFDGVTSGVVTYDKVKIDVPMIDGIFYIAVCGYVAGGKTVYITQRETKSTYSTKDLVVTGDSIETESAGRWAANFKNMLPFKSYFNGAVGGTCMSAVGDNYISSDTRISALPTKADIILVGGGTNDWGNNVPLGSLEDLSSDSNFAGAVYSMINKLQVKYPKALIIFTSNQNTCSPNRHNFDDATGFKNNLGLSASDYADMMEKVCKFAAIPYIDTNHLCGINRLNYKNYLLQETNYFEDAVYMHPNDDGANKMLWVIYRWFVNHAPL